MKKILFVLSTLLALTANAQAPKKFNYQSIARDGAGNFIPNQLVGYDIAIHQGSSSGTIAYEETQQATTNNYGLVNLAIGTGTVVTGSMLAINWANGPYYLEVKIDPTGGTTYTLTGTQELMSVPYALYADSSATPGPAGVGIDTAYVNNDSLYIHYTNGNTYNVGYVKGNTGAQGVSITNVQVTAGGQVQVTLSNANVINAGTLPTKSFLPFTFTSAMTTSSSAYASIPIQVLVPPMYAPFTTITAELSVNYLTSNGTTTGTAALMDYTNYAGGAITAISGSSVSLPSNFTSWTTVSSASFALSPGIVARVIFQRNAGTGTVQVQGATLTLSFN